MSGEEMLDSIRRGIEMDAKLKYITMGAKAFDVIHEYPTPLGTLKYKISPQGNLAKGANKTRG